MSALNYALVREASIRNQTSLCEPRSTTEQLHGRPWRSSGASRTKRRTRVAIYKSFVKENILRQILEIVWRYGITNERIKESCNVADIRVRITKRIRAYI